MGKQIKQWLSLILTMALATGVLLHGLTPAVFGQAVKGALIGTITDSSGAAVNGVSVTITDTRTNLSFTSKTNEDGNYTFSSIQDGVYRVEATLQGFKKAIQEDIQVKVNTTVRVDLTLQIGSVTEIVSVEA